MPNSIPLSPIFNAPTSVSQYGASPRAAGGGIGKGPFELVLDALNQQRAKQQELIQAAKKNLPANEFVAQPAHTQPSEAEKALAEYDAQLNKITQWVHQLTTRILDAIR